MGTNRIEPHFRDPTLDRPPEDFFVVKIEWETFHVDSDNAMKLISAMTEAPHKKIVRLETITGSVVYIQPSSVVFVRESTRAQRDSERRHWKRLDEEEDNDLGRND